MVFDIGRSVVEPRDGCKDDRKGLEAHTNALLLCVVYTNIYVCTSRIVCKLVCLGALHRQHNGHNPSFENILLDFLHILVLNWIFLLSLSLSSSLCTQFRVGPYAF